MIFLLFIISVKLIHCMQLNGLGGSKIPSINEMQDMAMLNQRSDVVCVGEALFDCIALPSAIGVNAENLIDSGDFIRSPGGAPANVACALSKLGVRSMFCGAMGNDRDGSDLQKMMSDKRVETLISVNEYPTRRVVVTRDSNGDRQFSGFAGGLKSSDFADTQYKPAVSAEWIANCASLAIVTGTLGLAHGSTAELLDKLARTCKARPLNIKTPLFIVDMNVRDVFWDSPDIDEKEMKQKHIDYVSGADIVKLTDEEAEWALNIPASVALQQPELVAAALNVRVGVLVTAGENGASCFVKGVGTCRSSGFEVDVLETTGAGDAFTAGFIAGLSIDRQTTLETPEGLQRALALGCASGALTVTKTGAIAAQPNLQEVLALMMGVPV